MRVFKELLDNMVVLLETVYPPFIFAEGSARGTRQSPTFPFRANLLLGFGDVIQEPREYVSESTSIVDGIVCIVHGPLECLGD